MRCFQYDNMGPIGINKSTGNVKVFVMVISLYLVFYFLSWPDESLPTNDTRRLIEVLCHDDNVVDVTVNSTFGKHYISETENLCFSQRTDVSCSSLISGKRRGRALVLCIKQRRDDWESQHDDALLILEKHLGLEVVLFPVQVITEYQELKQNYDYIVPIYWRLCTCTCLL